MKLGLILTNDWEIFGDGSGNYFEIQHNPLLNLIEILKEFQAKITIMAEVCQQFGFLSISENYDFAKKISIEWENILKTVIMSGSDVQLHIHPQWLDAKYENGKWKLNMNKWAISSFDEGTIDNIIHKGKNYLESIIQTVKPDYQCIAFRAGAYCIQPSNHVIAKLIKAGFLCDTSVTKGLVNDGFYDFSDAPSNILPWLCSENSVTEKGKSRLMELPIFSRMAIYSKVLEKFAPSFFFKIFFGVNVPELELKWQSEREKVKRQRYPREQRFYKTKQKKNFSFYSKALLSKSVIQLDYDYLPASVFVKILADIFEENSSKINEDTIIPVVASGHIKDTQSNDNLKWIFEKIKKDLNHQVVYWTLSDAIKYWYPKLLNC